MSADYKSDDSNYRKSQVPMTPIETHARNLAWIDERFTWFGVEDNHHATDALTTHRKVLELHGPEKIQISDGTVAGFEPSFIYRCRNCKSQFPDSTYRTITEGLGTPND